MEQPRHRQPNVQKEQRQRDLRGIDVALSAALRKPQRIAPGNTAAASAATASPTSVAATSAMAGAAITTLPVVTASAFARQNHSQRDGNGDNQRRHHFLRGRQPIAACRQELSQAESVQNRGRRQRRSDDHAAVEQFAFATRSQRSPAGSHGTQGAQAQRRQL